MRACFSSVIICVCEREPIDKITVSGRKKKRPGDLKITFSNLLYFTFDIYIFPVLLHTKQVCINSGLCGSYCQHYQEKYENISSQSLHDFHENPPVPRWLCNTPHLSSVWGNFYPPASSTSLSDLDTLSRTGCPSLTLSVWKGRS